MHIYRNSELFRFANRINLEIQAFGKAKISPPLVGQVMTPVFSRLYYINAGSFIITDNDSEAYRLESGKWYLIPAQYSFDYQCHESMEHVYFHIRLYDYDGTDLLRFCKRPLCLTDDSMFDSQLIDRCLRSNLLTDGLLLKQKVFDVVLHLPCANIYQAESFYAAFHHRDCTKCFCFQKHINKAFQKRAFHVCE